MKALLLILLLLASLKSFPQGKTSFKQLDSIDFYFAFNANGNVSFFDITQEGENRARWNDAWSNALTLSAKRSLQEGGLERAMVYYQYRLYKLAEVQYLKTKSYMEQNKLTNSIRYIKCISSIGLIYLVQGRWLEAEQYIQQALEQSSKKSVAYAASLNSLAILYQLQGKYSSAENLLNQIVELTEQIFTKNSVQYAIVINNQAMLYQEVGRYEEAIDVMKRSVEISQTAQEKIKFAGKSYLGEKAFSNRKFRTNLAQLYQVTGSISKAEQEFVELKKTFENRGQTNNPEYAGLLHQLACLYTQMEKMAEAESLFLLSSQIYKKKFSEENPTYANVESDLGNFYRMRKKYEDSEAALLKAIAIQKRILGEHHPDYVKTVEYLGILYWKRGEMQKAYSPLREATSKSLNFISQYFPSMSEAEKTKYWDVLQPRFQRFYNYAIEIGKENPLVLGDLFDYQIATKALLLNATSKMKKTILASGDKALIDEYRSWVRQKEALAQYYSLSIEELKKQEINITEQEKIANAAERSLSQRSSDFAKGFVSEKISYKNIASLLNESEALVEVIRINAFDTDFTGDAKYAVLVLTKDSSNPRMVVLNDGKKLETRQANYYKNAITQKIEDNLSFEQYWSPIEALLQGKKTIYLSPDGVYNQINVNTLKSIEGNFVINRFDIVSISNAKDMIAIKANKNTVKKKDAFLLGFPDYGGNAVALPGTKKEIKEINKILKASGFMVTHREQTEATEANLKVVDKPMLMHIATHGYFLEDANQEASAFGVRSKNAKDNPLLRSGLLLTGSSLHENKNASPDLESSDNGILTALEAMNLQLNGTELVTLSACETGLGNIKAGEGVYGLQRAFLVAGANALIMSLWKVDDDATRQLMTTFYTNWINLGDKHRAFREAQFQLMNIYKEPYYWGAFVMMGN